MHPKPWVRLRPSFLILVALFMLLGYVLHPFAVLSGGTEMGLPGFVAVFTVVLVVLIAVHEGAHVVAGQMHGLRLIGVHVGMKFSVTMFGDHTNRSARLTAGAGPAVGSVAAAAVILLAPAGSAMWFAGVIALVENVANVVLFFVPGSDGSKILRGHHASDEIAVPA